MKVIGYSLTRMITSTKNRMGKKYNKQTKSVIFLFPSFFYNLGMKSEKENLFEEGTMSKKNNTNPEIMGFKDKLGITLLSSNNGVAAIFMSTMFMSFMTDYAGLGTWGATLATTLLLVARIIDAIDDPIQSMIMDGAKPGKHGKYKPFFMISIIMTLVGVVALYGMPSGITNKPALVTVWVIFFYLVYDVGTSFYNINLLAHTMTNDTTERAKLIIGPRVWVMIISMIGSAFIAIAVSLYAFFGSYNIAFTILAIVAIGIGTVLAVIGWFMVKERHIVEEDEQQKVSFKDFITLLKENDAILIDFAKNLFSGFIWTMLFAAPSYYVKWGMCADLSTGEVDMALFGTYSLVVSMMMIMPLLLGTIVGNVVLAKVFKADVIKMQKFDYFMQGVGGVIIFIAHITGLARTIPATFFIGMFIMALFIGIDFIPGSAIGMDIMDYTVYKTGKDKSAMTSVFVTFLNKAQTAVSATLVGAILILIGYNVDSVTGNYVGELSSIPSMLTGMAIVTGIVPAVLAIISILILNKFPITAEVRAEMREALAKKEQA